jgi:hypothetical protein
MDLHGIVAPIIAVINPMVTAEWRQSAGAVTGASGARVPSYAPPVLLQVQVQALSGKDLQQMDMLNIQGVSNAIYVPLQAEGVMRPYMRGGDLLVIAGEVWLVVTVLERWPDWSKVAVSMQTDGFG